MHFYQSLSLYYSTQPIKNALKSKQLQISNKNDRLYLTTQNRRIHKYAQPLTGYVEETDFKRLEKIKNLVFPTFRKKDSTVRQQTISSPRDQAIRDGDDRTPLTSINNEIQAISRQRQNAANTQIVNFKSEYNRLSSMKLIKLDYDQNAKVTNNTLVIDFEYLKQKNQTIKPAASVGHDSLLSRAVTEEKRALEGFTMSPPFLNKSLAQPFPPNIYNMNQRKISLAAQFQARKSQGSNGSVSAIKADHTQQNFWNAQNEVATAASASVQNRPMSTSSKYETPLGPKEFESENFCLRVRTRQRLQNMKYHINKGGWIFIRGCSGQFKMIKIAGAPGIQNLAGDQGGTPACTSRASHGIIKVFLHRGTTLPLNSSNQGVNFVHFHNTSGFGHAWRQQKPTNQNVYHSHRKTVELNKTANSFYKPAKASVDHGESTVILDYVENQVQKGWLDVRGSTTSPHVQEFLTDISDQGMKSFQSPSKGPITMAMTQRHGVKLGLNLDKMSFNLNELGKHQSQVQTQSSIKSTLQGQYLGSVPK